MALNLDGTTDYLTPNFTIFTNSNFAGVSWVIGLIIAALSMVLITRSPDKWKKLALPLMAGWHMLGITNSFIILILAGIVYVADALTFSGATNPLTIFTTAAKQHDYNIETKRKSEIFKQNAITKWLSLNKTQKLLHEGGIRKAKLTPYITLKGNKINLPYNTANMIKQESQKQYNQKLKNINDLAKLKKMFKKSKVLVMNKELPINTYSYTPTHKEYNALPIKIKRRKIEKYY